MMHRSRLRLTTTAATALAFHAAPATAQQTATEPVFDIGAQVEVRHDTNVVRSSAERADLRGLVRSDTRIRPALTVELARPIGPHDVSLSGLVGYDFYQRNTRLNRERIALDGAGNLRLYPCELGLGVGVSRQQSQLLDTLLLVNDGPAAVDNAQTVQTYSAALACGRAIGIRPTVSVTRTIGDNSNVLRGRTNYRSWRYEGGVGYRQPSIGDVTLFASRQDTDFPDRANLIGQPTLPARPVSSSFGGYQVSRYGVRFERDIGARMRGELEVAFADVSASGVVGDNYNGPTYRTYWTINATPQLQARIGAARDVVTNLSNDSAYSLEQTYTLDASWAAGPRLVLTAGALVAPRRFFYGADTLALIDPAAGPVADPAGIRALLDESTRTQFAAGASYAVGPRLRFTLDSGYERRDATGDVFDFSNVFVTGGVRVSLR